MSFNLIKLIAIILQTHPSATTNTIKAIFNILKHQTFSYKPHRKSEKHSPLCIRWPINTNNIWEAFLNLISCWPSANLLTNVDVPPYQNERYQWALQDNIYTPPIHPVLTF